MTALAESATGLDRDKTMITDVDIKGWWKIEYHKKNVKDQISHGLFDCDFGFLYCRLWEIHGKCLRVYFMTCVDTNYSTFIQIRIALAIAHESSEKKEERLVLNKLHNWNFFL